MSPKAESVPGIWMHSQDRVYSEYVQTEIDRLTTSPKCGICWYPMHPINRELGHETHPCCDPNDPPTDVERAAIAAFLASNWQRAA